ncbi:MAG: tungstate ABC transporter substrate-binding protein WtpA [Candidatus Desulfofervidaceae bacterium]|nr:tungstate ABC transporter substrate-binding protein WtpA [Candidatus Desulfofervidaceae bacterium]
MGFKRIIIPLLVFILILSSNMLKAKDKVLLKVFHAGSLSVPFAQLEKMFEQKYPYVDVQREASGSVKAVRKVTELKKPCDVIAVADYSIIPKMMFPQYADYVKLFARNEIVLCYTDKSRYAKEITSQNWYHILSKPQVKWAFSNPNDDPCGYRTLISTALASFFYQKPDLFSVLLQPYTNLDWQKTGNNLLINVPANLTTKGHKVFIRPKSVELLALLESGAIDYAFEYKSVALQHHLHYLSLPPEINLGKLKYQTFYSQVQIKLGNGKIIQGKPIVYGIATLKTAPHPKEARLWEEFVTGQEGARVLKAHFQTPIFPAQLLRDKQ